MRLEEQRASARVGGYEVDVLRCPDGTVPREACLDVSAPLLAGLWKAIRDFEPDYLFCPPVAADPLAGVHVDHVAVAEAVRKVAYMINVPHAFTPEYPADEAKSEPCKTPVILNVHDGYMHGSNSHDFAVDIGPVFDRVAEMAWCHQSQIREWLPWVGRHKMQPPASLAEWNTALRGRFMGRNRELAIEHPAPTEVFTVTAWGVVPTLDQLLADFPAVLETASNLKRLEERLKRWS